MGCPIISLTAQGGSNLARYSDITLTIGKLREAGPLGLAPTTTTTTMLALGDALAMAVLNQKDFTKEQFAFFHPGGEIGRSLLTVQEVMRTGEENCIVHENVRVREMLHSITNTKGRPGAASVVHSDGTLAGVYTDGQLRRDLEQGADFLDFPASKVMTAKPKTILPDKLADEAMRLMSEFKIDQLIVVDEANKPIGLIDIQDLVSIRPKV
jgi:arabinose-5-phosphate isomerase